MTTRPFHELSPLECVLAVADRYDVEVRIMPSKGIWRAPRSAKEGPVGHFADMRARRVWLDQAILDPHDVAVELHEVIHCIVVPPRGSERFFLEHHGLMPLETALARSIFPHRRQQRDHVRAYQAITRVKGEQRIGDWKRWERTSWWQEGERFMRRIGFLDERGAPTWRRGEWPSLDVMRAHADRVDAMISAATRA